MWPLSSARLEHVAFNHGVGGSNPSEAIQLLRIVSCEDSDGAIALRSLKTIFIFRSFEKPPVSMSPFRVTPLSLDLSLDKSCNRCEATHVF